MIYDLMRALGAGKKLAVGSASVADGGTIDTGLKSIDAAFVCSSDKTHIAAVTGVSGGTITVGLADNAGTAITTAETVYWLAIGE